MNDQIVKQGKGRPITGSESKSRLRKFYIEPTLDDELKYSCRILRIPVSEGIRRGIMMFVRDTEKKYYNNY